MQHPVPVQLQTAQHLAEELLPEEQNAGSNRPTPPSNLGDSTPAVILDLTSKEWIHPPGTEWIPWVEMPRSFRRDRLQNMPVRGRKSREDKEAEESSDAILRSSSWVVSDEVHINIVEQLILMLCVSFHSIDTSRYIYIFGAMQKLSLCVLFLIAETA
jgi:hypothetical protein